MFTDSEKELFFSKICVSNVKNMNHLKRYYKRNFRLYKTNNALFLLRPNNSLLTLAE